MKFLLGTKQQMTQFFAENGHVFPATVVSLSPVVVTAIKTVAENGYSAVQVGFGTSRPSLRTKAELGHSKEPYKVIREFRLESDPTFAVGDVIDPTLFDLGQKVAVSGISKGKGFQGVVKRHGFGGGRRSHGQKHSEREHGSIGGGLRTRVPKGMRMGGRMGTDRITVKNLQVLHIDKAVNEMYIKGAIPGRRGTLLEIIG